MKTFIFSLILLGLTTFSKAQNGKEYVDLAEQKAKVGDYSSAIILLDKAEQEGATDIYCNRAYYKQMANDFQGALKDYDICVERSSIYVKIQLIVARAKLKLKMKDFNGVISDCTQALEISDKYAEALFYRAEAKKALGDLPGACEDYKKAAVLENFRSHEGLDFFISARKKNCGE